MELYFQCGSGFEKLSQALTEYMPGGTYILSPRDLSQKGQLSFAGDLRKSGNKVLIDSQLYAPHSDEKNFQTYDYWPKDNFVTDVAPWKDLVNRLYDLNTQAGTDAFILPGVACRRVGMRFLAMQDAVIDAASACREKQKIATLCLAQNVLLDTVQIERLLAATEVWPVDGVYVIAEHPDDDYFVDSPMWLFNLFKLCAGLTIQGKKVIAGYSNHQMLALSCAGVHAIASGNWMNARSFTFDKFKEPDPDEIKRHKLWYYAPQAFTEFSPQYLDLAKNSGKLPILALQNGMKTPATILFSEGVSPSATNFNNENSFVHYLYCLHKQVAEVSSSASFVGRKDKFRELAGTAKKVLSFLHKYRINGQNRDFMDYFEVTMTALELFSDQAGPLLSRMNYLYARV